MPHPQARRPTGTVKPRRASPIPDNPTGPAPSRRAARRASPIPEPTGPPRQLVIDLLAAARAAGTGAGHLAIKSTSEHLGVCTQSRHYAGGRTEPAGAGYRVVGQVLTGTCTPAYQRWAAAIRRAEAWLAAPDHHPHKPGTEDPEP
jgi:hypothetical protein